MNKKEKTKIGFIIAYFVLGIITVIIVMLIMLNKFLCPTYFLYPDFWIKTMRQGAVEDTFGEFDIKNDVMGAYYIYTDDNEQRHYYVIYFGDIGSRPDYIVDDTIIVNNPRGYYLRGEEPEYITQEFYMYLFWKNLRAHTYRDVGPLCDYFQITEEEFMKDALSYVAVVFQESPHIRENAVEQLGDYTAWQDEIYEFGNMLFNNNEIMDIEDICEEHGLTEDLFYKGLMLEAEEICEQHY